MEEKDVKVGLFDSGVGGLNVLAACRRALPAATFFYYGDNGRAPYGSRPAEEIERFVVEGMDALAACGVHAAVLACNTATAVCAEAMRERYSFPVLGMEPAVKPAAEKYNEILILATPRTAESERLRTLVNRFPGRRITVCAAPFLAGAIEARLTRGERFSLSEHLPPAKPEGVVLGCTHYSFCRREIAAFYGCEVFDGCDGTARHLLNILKLGPSNHSIPPLTPSDPVESCQKIGEGRAIFFGKTGKMNEAVYNSNVCSIF